MTDRTYTLAYLRRGNGVLLAMKKCGFGASKWNGAGGKVETGESVEQALLRECQEEISIMPTTYRKVTFNDFVMTGEHGQLWHQWGHIFIVAEWEGEPTESEEMAPQWFTQSNIPFDEMWDNDIHWLPLILDGKLLESIITIDANDHMLTKEIREVKGFDD